MIANNTKELVMDRRIVWHANSLKQIDEAKAMILKYKGLGYEIVKSDGTPMERFNPRYEEIIIKAKKVKSKHVMKVLCDKGDDRIVWDKEDGHEAKSAKAKFVELLKKGYKAFSVDRQSNKNRGIEEFDVDAEEVLMVPPTSKG